MSESFKGLQLCDPYQRTFPLSWKEAYFRMNFNEELGGYVCPICKKVFRGTKGFGQLRADHIHPFSKGGLTVWQNLQLLCVKCNSEKSDNLSILE
ncbi:HNH endonuclease [Scytonema sp. PRP1]|jgi:5-methylcytosine-specific restriction endonuclease McrA|uniref:HNH endonuclease n=1 Tax=Scytonema sp. PRP1 TaxID=3120513 RepID=UPI003FA7ECE5